MSNKDNTMKWRHYLWAFFGGLFLTVVSVIIYACWHESSNKKTNGQWRWKDWLYMVAFGLLGQAVQVIIIYLNYTY